MLETAAAGQQATSEHQQMDAAMTQSATDEGLNRQELAGFMRDLNTQNSAAHSTLASQMQANMDGTRKAAEAHAQSIAQEIATQSRKQDQRDEVVEQLRQSLAQAHQTPASVPIPPAPATQEVHNHYHQHHQQLRFTTTITLIKPVCNHLCHSRLVPTQRWYSCCARDKATVMHDTTPRSRICRISV